MDTRPLIGKTIKKIHQHQYKSSGGCKAFGIDTIEFTDGSRLTLCGMERDDASDYEVHGEFYSAAESTVDA